LGVAIVTFVAVAADALLLRSPFGHDESVYALKAKDLAYPGLVDAKGFWTPYRAPGLPALLSVLFRIQVTALGARIVVVIFGVVALALIWALGRRLVDPTVGGLAAILAALTPAFTITYTFLLVDGPGATLSLAAILLFLPILDGSIRWSRTAAIIGFAWLATIIRFGAPISFGVGLGTVGAVAAVRALREKDYRRLADIAVVGVGTLMSIPLFYWSELLTTSGISPMEANEALKSSKGLTASTGWRDLKTWLNREILGHHHVLAISLVVLAGSALAIGLAIRSPRLRLPVLVFAVGSFGTALGIVVAVGLIQTNYLVISVPFVALLASVGIVETSRLLPPLKALRLGALAVFVLVAFATSRDRTNALHETLAKSSTRLRDASYAVADQTEGNCLIISSYYPQLSWFSGCAGAPFPRAVAQPDDNPEVLGTYADIPTSATAAFEWWQQVDERADPDGVALLIIDRGKRQPTAEEIEAARHLYVKYFFTDLEARFPLFVAQLDPCLFNDSCNDHKRP